MKFVDRIVTVVGTRRVPFLAAGCIGTVVGTRRVPFLANEWHVKFVDRIERHCSGTVNL